MAIFSRVTPTGWSQGDDTTSFSRVTPTGWEQVTSSTTTVPAVILSNGQLSYTPTAQATDFKLAISSGVLYAKQTLSAGDRIITLVNGQKQAGTPT